MTGQGDIPAEVYVRVYTYAYWDRPCVHRGQVAA